MRDTTQRPMTSSGPAADSPLSGAGLDRLGAYGRQDHGFHAAARHVVGLRLLILSGCASRDRDAREGLERAEAVALLSLALTPATTLAELDLRQTLFDGGCGSAFANLASMLEASLAADAKRLRADARRDARPGFHADDPGRTAALRAVRRRQAGASVANGGPDGRA